MADCQLGETSGCIRSVSESGGGSACELLLRGRQHGLTQSGTYAVHVAPLYRFNEEWSVRDW
jgi:hypothetical protein